MDYIKLRSKEVQEQKFKQKTNIFKIRVINTPKNYDLYYYPKQNLFVRYNYDKFHFYTIHEDVLQKRDINIKYYSNDDPLYKDRVLFLGNSIILIRSHHLIKYNIENLTQSQILNACLRPSKYQFSDITQINNKNFMTTWWSFNRLLIYQIRNFQKSHTILTKQKIISTKYFSQMVQAITKQHLYYYNTKMTKQIRKYCGYREYEPIFNSNYLLVPFYQRIKRRRNLMHINVYDICSMKIKGVIETKNRQYQIFDSSLFIKEHNIIAILYSNKLDLFDFNTLNCVGSENIDNGYEQSMQYDQENGLTIFLKRNYHLKE